jgi:hypothetical protein
MLYLRSATKPEATGVFALSPLNLDSTTNKDPFQCFPACPSPDIHEKMREKGFYDCHSDDPTYVLYICILQLGDMYKF